MTGNVCTCTHTRIYDPYTRIRKRVDVHLHLRTRIEVMNGKDVIRPTARSRRYISLSNPFTLSKVRNATVNETVAYLRTEPNIFFNSSYHVPRFYSCLLYRIIFNAIFVIATIEIERGSRTCVRIWEFVDLTRETIRKQPSMKLNISST